MTWTVAIKKARAITDVCGNIAARRQRNSQAGSQGVALIVIEEKKVCRRTEVCESPSDRALSLGALMRISEIELPTLEELRRMRRHFEGANSRSFDGQRKEDVRVTQRVVIEEVLRGSMEVAGVDGPSFDRKSCAELVFFVAVAAQGNKIDTLGQRKLE